MEDESSSWKFVAVDPLAPKRRRRKRLVEPEAKSLLKKPRLVVEAETEGEQQQQQLVTLTHVDDDIDWDSFLQGLLAEGQSSRSPSPALDDFDRFFILSDDGGQPASAVWSMVFRDAYSAPSTPLASNIIETSLFNFYSRETVRASVSFDDNANPFRGALLPLAASNPAVFHGALAVASAHWINRLKLVERQWGLDGSHAKQLRLLELASSYHAGIARDMVEGDSCPDDRGRDESQAACSIVLETLETFTNGLQVRAKALRVVHAVVRRYSQTKDTTTTSMFLRMWLKWIDTLDATAQRRGRLTFDERLGREQQLLLDNAVKRTSGCNAESMRLISATARLSQRRNIRSLDELQSFSVETGELQAEILAALGAEPPNGEEQLASHCFNLALYLYFSTSVLQVALDSGPVKWAVKELLDMTQKAGAYRQAWATWPYFILGVHVIKSEDQDRVRGLFAYLESTLSIGNLSTLRDVLDELWRKRALGQVVEWQDVSIAMRGSIVSPL